MSLDTILKIGKALRESKDNLKFFKYVNTCPKDKEGNYSPTCLSVPVKEDYSFDWNNISLVPENKESLLFYLKFKTSDSDGLVKYVFGDILYAKGAKIKKDGSIEKREGGFYRLGNPKSIAAYQKSSFERGQNDFNDIVKNDEAAFLKTFRTNLENDLDVLETILANISAVEEYLFENIKIPFLDFLSDDYALSNATIKQLYEKISKQNKKKLGIESEFLELSDLEKERLMDFDYGEIFIHFDFPENRQWYNFEREFELITNKMLADFVEESENGIVLKKTLYKTLCSGDNKNDWQFPDFNTANKHKSKAFTNDEIQDLFYAIDYSSKGKTISGTDIKIILLPRGENLKAEDFEEFREKRDESRIKKSNESTNNNEEPLFDIFEKEGEESIISFDVIFCKKGGTSSPDVDLLEISGIEKSKIKMTRQRLEKVSKEIAVKRKVFLRTDKDLFPFKLEYSFRNILGNPLCDLKTNKVTIKANPKYQSHILKILPLIYTDNYHHDDVLLPAFIQNIEYSIRSGDNKFNLLKFDLEYLFKIQNSKNNLFMKITNSESYHIGLLLGSLAKNLAQEINSFEKNYVGNLTRRISNISDFIKMKNDIEQKLIMHDKSKYTFKISHNLALKVKVFEEQYDKEECAFGFFESYFRPIQKKQEVIEK